jgi:hypothetical protein
MLATPGPNGAPVSDPSLYDERIDIVSIAPDFKRQIAATLGAELIQSPVPRLVPGIHVLQRLRSSEKDVGGRNKSGHGGVIWHKNNG